MTGQMNPLRPKPVIGRQLPYSVDNDSDRVNKNTELENAKCWGFPTSVARRSRYIGRPSMDGVYLSRISGRLNRFPSYKHIHVVVTMRKAAWY